MTNSASKPRRSMRIKALSTAAALAVVGGAMFGAAPAFAATSNCPSGYLCTWGDADFKTGGTDSALIKFQYYIPDYGGYNYAGTSKSGANSATSIYNHGTSETAYMYASTSKSGFLFSIPKGNTNNNLWWQGKQNDNIESGYYYTYN